MLHMLFISSATKPVKYCANETPLLSSGQDCVGNCSEYSVYLVGILCELISGKVLVSGLLSVTCESSYA